MHRFILPALFLSGVRSIMNPSSRWILICTIKITGWVATASLTVLVVLWVLDSLHLFVLVLTYEALFTLLVGVVQILSSYIYKKDSIQYRGGFRVGWFDFKKFAKLKPRERHRYRQEGVITVAIALVLLAATTIIQFSALR